MTSSLNASDALGGYTDIGPAAAAAAVELLGKVDAHRSKPRDIEVKRVKVPPPR
jgi:hypothetical protein